MIRLTLYTRPERKLCDAAKFVLKRVQADIPFELNDHLICLDCGYVLAGLPKEHTCPECSKAYVADEIRTAWQNWLMTGDMRRSTF